MDLDLSTLSAPAPVRRGRPFRILVVCTGNICRSAYAAALLRARLDAVLSRGTVEVTSAGTDVATTVAMPQVIREGIRALGVDPDEHRITALEPDAIEDADLVLTMTARQRAAVVRIAPSAASRVQMLTQFLRLSRPVRTPPAADPADGMRAMTAAAAARRGLDPGVDEDISDPWGRDDAFFRRCIGQIRTCGDEIADRLLAAGRTA